MILFPFVEQPIVDTILRSDVHCEVVYHTCTVTRNRRQTGNLKTVYFVSCKLKKQYTGKTLCFVDSKQEESFFWGNQMCQGFGLWNVLLVLYVIYLSMGFSKNKITKWLHGAKVYYYCINSTTIIIGRISQKIYEWFGNEILITFRIWFVIFGVIFLCSVMKYLISFGILICHFSELLFSCPTSSSAILYLLTTMRLLY